MSELSSDVNLLNDLIKKAIAAGADAADAIQVNATSVSASMRLGKTESVERAEASDLGLRVFIGKQQATVSTSDSRPDTLRELVSRAVAMAKAAPEDIFCGLADPNDIAKNWPQLDLADSYEPSGETLIAQVREAENAALAIKGISNSEGAEAGYGRSTIVFAASNGFIGTKSTSSFSLNVTVIAGEGTGMERDHDYATRVYASDMPSPASIGKNAGERAVYERIGFRHVGARRRRRSQALQRLGDAGQGGQNGQVHRGSSTQA